MIYENGSSFFFFFASVLVQNIGPLIQSLSFPLHVTVLLPVKGKYD